MDKKNTIIGVLLLCAAFYFMVNPGRQAQNREDEARLADDNEVRRELVEKSSKPAEKGDITSPFAPEENIKEEILSLQSEFLKVHLTNRGGAIRDVELLKYKHSQDSDAPFVFNESDSDTLAMAIALQDPISKKPFTLIKNFALVSADEKSVEYEYIFPKKFKIVRKFALSENKKDLASPYVIDVSTSITNISDETSSEKFFLTLGAMNPTAGDIYGGNLAVGLYDGSSMHFAKSSLFVGSDGFLGLGKSAPLSIKSIDVEDASWATAKNQFFASVFTPTNKRINGAFAEPLLINPQASDKYMRNAIFGYAGFNVSNLAPGQTWTLLGKYYVGPKDMTRLASMGANQDLVMDFGWFSFVSKPLSILMTIIHSVIEPISPVWAWGWAIVILTLIVRLIMWPLTAAQIRSSQKMLKLGGHIKAIKEKFQGDQQKIGQETMKLYSEYGINPLAGCFPAFIQIPVFIGLYYMLQTSSDIRFAHFLWINDLALPDTIEALPTIFGYPLHVLPIMNALLTVVQMSITPMPSADKTQAMMFRFMPLIFLVLFYNFPSGLILYWAVQSSLGILQALVVRHGSKNLELQKVDPSKKKKSGFMQRMQAAIEQAEKASKEGGGKMSMRETMEKAKELRLKQKEDRLKGTMYEKRKKNPGGRSTKPKRK